MVRARWFPGEAAGEVGGARPVAGGEAKRLPGAARTRAGQLAGGGKMRAEKKAAKRRRGCPYLNNSGR